MMAPVSHPSDLCFPRLVSSQTWPPQLKGPAPFHHTHYDSLSRPPGHIARGGELVERPSSCLRTGIPGPRFRTVRVAPSPSQGVP